MLGNPVYVGEAGIAALATRGFIGRSWPKRSGTTCSGSASTRTPGCPPDALQRGLARTARGRNRFPAVVRSRKSAGTPFEARSLEGRARTAHSLHRAGVQTARTCKLPTDQCAYKALISRIELSADRMKIVVRCPDVRRFLTWDDVGSVSWRQGWMERPHATELIDVPASGVRLKRLLWVPIKQRESHHTAVANIGWLVSWRAPARRESSLSMTAPLRLLTYRGSSTAKRLVSRDSCV